MDFLADYFGDIPPPFNVLLDRGSQTFWLTYIGAIAVSALVYIWRRQHKSLRLRALVRYALSIRLFKHKSSLLDLKLYLAAAIYLFLQSGFLIFLSDFLIEHFSAFFSPRAGGYLPSSTLAKIFVPVAIFLVFELGYWVGHFLLHKVSWLWEFHKVHHSAEIMTPVTELRQHPVELFMVPFVTAPFLAFTYAGIFWLFGPEMEIYKYWDLNIFIFSFYMTFGHLRHSHVNISTSGIWSYIFQSPLHHQIHHSTDPKHFDTNLGFCLSVWDWAFGTLYLPEKGQKIEFGVDDELRTNYSLKTHLFEPFRQAWLVLTGRKRPYAKTVTRSTINS